MAIDLTNDDLYKSLEEQLTNLDDSAIFKVSPYAKKYGVSTTKIDKRIELLTQKYYITHVDRIGYRKAIKKTPFDEETLAKLKTDFNFRYNFMINHMSNINQLEFKLTSVWADFFGISTKLMHQMYSKMRANGYTIATKVEKGNHYYGKISKNSNCEVSNFHDLPLFENSETPAVEIIKTPETGKYILISSFLYNKILSITTEDKIGEFIDNCIFECLKTK